MKIIIYITILLLIAWFWSCNRKPKYHFVEYTFIDTVKNDTSREGISIDAVSNMLLDSNLRYYNKEGFKEIFDKLMKYGNKDTTIYFGVNHCDLLVNRPYCLIKFSNNTYGLLKIDEYVTWYKTDEDGHDFTNVKEAAKQYLDTCDAKNDLYTFLTRENKFKYQPLNK